MRLLHQPHLELRRRQRARALQQRQDPGHVCRGLGVRAGCTCTAAPPPGRRCRRRARAGSSGTASAGPTSGGPGRRSRRPGRTGSAGPYEAAVPGMNCAIPWAPAGETAFGLKPDSAISCAASTAPETFQRAGRALDRVAVARGDERGQARRSSRRRRDHAPASRRDSPAAEHGAGPAVEPVVPRLPASSAARSRTGARWPRASRRRRTGRGRARSRSGAGTAPAAPPRSGRGAPRTARACSASERKPELTTSAWPAARAAGAIWSNARRDVGPHALAVPVDERPAVSAAGRLPRAARSRSAAVRPRPGFGDSRRDHR